MTYYVNGEVDQRRGRKLRHNDRSKYSGSREISNDWTRERAVICTLND